MSNENEKNTIDAIISRDHPVFKKTQNQRLWCVEQDVLTVNHLCECFLPLTDENRKIAELLAGDQGQIKQVPEHGFIYVKTDPKFIHRLEEAGKLNMDQTEQKESTPYPYIKISGAA